jgi:hypothetical protein
MPFLFAAAPFASSSSAQSPSVTSKTLIRGELTESDDFTHAMFSASHEFVDQYERCAVHCEFRNSLLKQLCHCLLATAKSGTCQRVRINFDECAFDAGEAVSSPDLRDHDPGSFCRFPAGLLKG